jgi:hypothetical protein
MGRPDRPDRTGTHQEDGDRDNEHRTEIASLRPGEMRRRATRGNESPRKGI